MALDSVDVDSEANSFVVSSAFEDASICVSSTCVLDFLAVGSVVVYTMVGSGADGSRAKGSSMASGSAEDLLTTPFVMGTSGFGAVSPAIISNKWCTPYNLSSERTRDHQKGDLGSMYRVLMRLKAS